MARSKEWTDEDREAALGWIARKAKTGAIFVGQDETADDMLPMLEGVTDLQAFSESVQAALTTSAWKRLLGALRQRKHQADDEDQGQGPQQAEQQACRSCVQLRSEVESLQTKLSDATAHVALAKTLMDRLQKAAAEDSDYMLDMQGHIDRLEEFLGDHGLLDEDGELIEEEVEPDNVIVTQSAPEPTEHEGVIGDHALSDEGGHQVTRDRAIITMHQAGESKRGIARALDISDGTVRNVLRRLQTEAA